MNVPAIAALVRKDLRIFFSDRRAVMLSFAAPIAIASFFGFLFGGSATSSSPARIPVQIADEDHSRLSRAVVQALTGDSSLQASVAAPALIRDSVRRGRVAVGIIIPAGFGRTAGRAFFTGADKPTVRLLYDPSKSAELAMVRGILTGHVMQTVSGQVFNGATGRQMIDQSLGELDHDTTMPPGDRHLLRDLLQSVQRWYARPDRGGADASSSTPYRLSVPYRVDNQAVTAGRGIAYNAYAHAFAGMGVQFVLFISIEIGVGVLLERQRGLWKRLRSAPLSKLAVLGARTVSGAILALSIFVVMFAFGMAVFGIRIQGSVAGFAAVLVACSLMAATFGLLIAALGRTPQAARGVSVFAVLVMVMVGGAWVPSFLFPVWLQRAALVVPASWAVNGLDAMVWRGLGLSSAIAPTLVLLAFTVLFGAVAVARFRWEEE